MSTTLPVHLFGQSGGQASVRMDAPKNSKCLCGKRAQGTLMSPDGRREILPCCFRCGLVILEALRRLENDEAALVNGVPKDLHDWFVSDSGISSMVIASILVPSLRSSAKARLNGTAGVPHDPEDFGRCHRLLKLIENGPQRLVEVAAVHPEWAPLVAAWPELARLYEAESPSGKAPRLYKRMKEIRNV